jgi:hypothetical protein
MCDPGKVSEPINDIYLNQAKESYKSNNYRPVTIKIKFSFNVDRLKQHIDQLMRTFNASDRPLPVPALPVNISNLVRKGFALSGTGVCTPNLLPNYTAPIQRKCSCEIGCIYDCCDDFAIMQPWACVNEFYPKMDPTAYSTTDYLTIGGCMEQHKEINDWCNNRNSSDFYQMFPVNDRFGDGPTYANIFCYLCNKKTIDYQSFNNIIAETAVWAFVAECKGYINYRHFNSMQNFINFALANECDLKFEPHRRVEECQEKPPISNYVYVSRCNSYRPWSSVDSDVRFACEILEHYRFPRIISEDVGYRNKFCLLCNPNTVDTNGLVDSCAVSNTTSPALYKACRELPDVHACSYFKNVFCAMCNGLTGNCYNVWHHEIGPGTISPTTPPTPPGFRSMFSILGYTDPPTKVKTQSCPSDQLHDEYYVNKQLLLLSRSSQKMSLSR